MKKIIAVFVCILIFANPFTCFAEIALVEPWEDRTLREKYNYVMFNGVEYHASSGKKLTAEQVDAKLFYGETYGFNEYELTDDPYMPFKRYAKNAMVYQIKTISIEYALAVKYDGYKGYYPFYTACSPKYLGEFANGINLKENVKFGTIYYYTSDGEQKYELTEPAVIADMLFSDGTLKNEFKDGEIYQNKVIDISSDIPLLGVKNVSVSVSGDGYMYTNLSGYGQKYNIGKDKTNAFIKYVLKHGKPV